MSNQKGIHIRVVRWVILGVILGVSMVLHYLHIHEGVKFPSVHAICPYGGLENLWAWLAGRANIQKIFSGTMVLFFLTIIFALLFGRSFCGNICPFGGLQELIGLLFPKKYRIPDPADKYLRYLKYVILLVSVYMAWVTATLWMSPFDPWAAFAHIYQGNEFWHEFTIGAILLIITIIASLFISRFFCKYLCPAGALYALVGMLSPLKVKRDPKKCIQCGVCANVCPMDIAVNQYEKVPSSECIACGHCITPCPKPGTMISLKMAGVQLKPLMLVFMSVILFFGSIWIFDSMNLYRVSLPTQAEVEQSKEYLRIADLRGSMTIEQGAFYTGKDLKEFYRIMEIPETVPKETLLKHVQYYLQGYDFHVMKAMKGNM